MAKFDRATINGATAQAASTLLQGLGGLLIKKGVITGEEWKACIADAAHFLRRVPNATPDQQTAAKLLAAFHIGMEDREKGTPPN
jgi:hypothetical protein